jgi:peptidoglycan hydrolase-like protein with peptidoglycan-binding domain
MAASTLSERMRQGGIVADPAVVITEARRAGIPLALACALLEKETAGGHNVFGHDRDRSGHYIFPARDGTVPVTEDLYRQYKQRRKATGLPQGVGPCQLTFAGFQDQADALGGCWKPEANIRVGFKVLADNIRVNGQARGVARYNGSGSAADAYSKDVLAKARRWEALLAGASGAGVKIKAAPGLVRRGDHGKRVERITRRLAYVHSRNTKAPYLASVRQRFDGAAVAALKAFQREHGLLADGVFGEQSARKLARAVKAEKARRQRGGTVAPARPTTPEKTSVRVARLPGLVKEVAQLDAETGRAWDELVEYGRRRARLVERIKGRKDEDSAVVESLSEMTKILLRIEGKLGEIVEIEEHEEAAAAASATKAVAADTKALAEKTAALAEQAGAATVTVTKADEIAPPAPEGPALPPPLHNGVPPADVHRRLSDLTENELLDRVAKLDRLLDRSRAELVSRYAKTEEEIARLRPKFARRVERVRTRAATGGTTKSTTTRGGGGKRGGKVVVTKVGDRGLLVRRSKVALVRFLKQKGNAEHAKLRRALRREARAGGNATLATPSWMEAVKAVQHITGRPVTGEMDGDLVKVLQPYWPRDNAGKRVLRATPGAWRVIPGQLTPNFNIKELACKDAAHTAYAAGLMREQNLTKKQAHDRARELAKRLERLRKLGGDHPVIITSAFRTQAYNASLEGSAKNSAHTRGFACDTPPPRGVTLAQHEEHVLKAFECGVGYYPPGHGNFIHGDFDHTLGGRRRWGH